MCGATGWIHRVTSRSIYSFTPGHELSEGATRISTNYGTSLWNWVLRAIFSSQRPGGIDWGTHPYIPTTKEEVAVPTPFPYISVFRVDFRENIRVLWGEDFRQELPEAPDPVTLAEPWIYDVLEKSRSIKNSPKDRQRAAYAAYKAILVAQLFFGDPHRSAWVHGHRVLSGFHSGRA